jgi:hypothetical protein
LPGCSRLRRLLEVVGVFLCCFATFWLIFAGVLILSNFPFLVISMALTIVAAFSAIIVALSWAYQNNW